MNLSSRGIGKKVKKYKNNFWKLFFYIKFVRKLLPKLNDKVQITIITEYKLESYDMLL